MKKSYSLFVSFVVFVTGLHAQSSLVKSMNLFSYMARVNQHILFFGCENTDPGNYELWSSDGTATGTHQVTEIYPGSTSGVIGQDAWNAGFNYYTPIVYNNSLYFVAQEPLGDYLYKSDGTAAGTVRVEAPGITFNWGDQQYPYFCVMNGILYFTASDGHHGIELWRTDGTSTGTFSVKNISLTNFNGSQPSHLIAFNGSLYFSANDDNDGVELFKSDGTAAGTQVLTDFLPGAAGIFNDGFGGSINPWFTVSGNYLYFIGNSDPVTPNFSLFRTDGTAAGTILLSNHLLAKELTDVNGTLYFYADDANGVGIFGLYKSDGTPGGTVAVTLNNLELYPGAYEWQKSFYAFNNNLYFPASINDNNSSNFGEYQSDGTTAGTTLSIPLPGPTSGIQSHGYNRDGTAGSFFFTDVIRVKGSSSDLRMIESNGTPAGQKIYWGVSANAGTDFLNGDLFFSGRDTTFNSGGQGLYKITPSFSGTPLPLTWLSFDAALTPESTVDLKWETASETNNKGFSVERSTDGVQFADLQWVAGNGNSSQAISYAWTDKSPVPGSDYYRISQVDLDGKSTYSPVKKVDIHPRSILSVAPNPVVGNILVIQHAMGAGQALVKVTDMGGRTVFSQLFSLSGNQLSCNIQGLKAGVYTMTLTGENQLVGSCQFVKK